VGRGREVDIEDSPIPENGVCQAVLFEVWASGMEQGRWNGPLERPFRAKKNAQAFVWRKGQLSSED
jgi:hypothetical protein